MTTHYHPEHSLGASAFKGAKLLMTRDQQQDMTELGKQIQDTFAKRSALTAELLNGVPYPTPDILFDREYRLDLGGVHARLMWRGPAAMHTAATHDLRRRGSRPVHRRRGHESTLSRSAEHVEHHDLAGDARRTGGAQAGARRAEPRRDRRRDADARDRAFLQAVQNRVGELKRAGKSVDEAVAAIVAEIAPAYPEWGNPQVRPPSPARVHGEAR